METSVFRFLEEVRKRSSYVSLRVIASWTYLEGLFHLSLFHWCTVISSVVQDTISGIRWLSCEKLYGLGQNCHIRSAGLVFSVVGSGRKSRNHSRSRGSTHSNASKWSKSSITCKPYLPCTRRRTLSTLSLGRKSTIGWLQPSADAITPFLLIWTPDSANHSRRLSTHRCCFLYLYALG